MLSLQAVAMAAALFITDQERPASRGAECAEWQQCRQLALEAAGREDFELFHDLAWRAVQKGPKNDPSLMHLLARAQSLSGRPGDALVMLGRLTDLGVATDAATSEDFRRVRSLGGWPALKERLDAMRARAAPETAPATIDRRGEKPSSERPSVKPELTGDVAEPKAGTNVVLNAPASETADDAVQFATFGPPPVGIAYDSVSRRFVVAVRETRKLSVVDEFSHHVATLSGAQAGFDDVAALEIDAIEGNLWVTSFTLPSEEPTATTTLHKLQLVSGRVLSAFRVPDTARPARFIDVAVSARSTVFALDELGQRIFRLRPASQTLEVAATLAPIEVTSIAPVSDLEAYVAHVRGISRVDLGTGAATAVRADSKVDLSGLSRIRWFRGSLVGIQKAEDGWRIVRVTLDRSGLRATKIESLDPAVSVLSPTAATIAGEILYYLAGSVGSNVNVRRVRLK